LTEIVKLTVKVKHKGNTDEINEDEIVGSMFTIINKYQ